MKLPGSGWTAGVRQYSTGPLCTTSGVIAAHASGPDGRNRRRNDAGSGLTFEGVDDPVEVKIGRRNLHDRPLRDGTRHT